MSILRYSTIQQGFVRVLVIGCGILNLSFSPSVSHSLPTSLNTIPFAPGEQLIYSLSVWGIPAGQARMEVSEIQNFEGRKQFRLVSEMKTNAFFSWFFPVHNEVYSDIDSQTLLPNQLIFHRREGSRHEDFHIRFDRSVRTAIVIKDDVRTEWAFPPHALGPLSCLYFLRHVANLESQQTISLGIFHDKKYFDVMVKVEKIETLKGVWGERETIRVLVVMPFKGIFLNKGNIRIWLTNDDQRVPVKMKAKVVLGSVVAELNHPIKLAR